MKIKNKDLVNVINFLNGLSVKGLKGIHRTSISNKLQSKLEAFGDAQQQLQKDFKDDAEGHRDEFRKLLNQYNTIDDTDSKVEITSLKSIVKPLISEDSDEEFSEGDALGLYSVYIALELGGEE